MLIEISRANRSRLRTSGLVPVLVHCFRFRRLLIDLVKQDLLMPDRYSFLGILWLFITPLAGVASWLILDGIGILRPGNAGVPYVVYAFCGSLWWGLFMGLFQDLSFCLFRHQHVFLQTVDHRDIMLLSTVLASLSRFAFVWLFVAAVLLLSGKLQLHPALFLSPLFGLPLILSAGGLGLFMAPIAGIAPDIERISRLFFSLAFYLAPVVYVAGAAEFPAWLSGIAAANPLGFLIAAPRDALLNGVFPSPLLWAALLGVSVLIVLAGWKFFIESEPYVLERIM